MKRSAGLLAFVLCVAGQFSAAADLPVYVPDIVIQPDDPKLSAEVVERRAARDGTTLEITLKPAAEDFVVDFDFVGTHLKSLRLVLLELPSPHRLEYVFKTKRGDSSVTMLDTAGVTVAPSGKNCLIDFGPAALAKLTPTGRLRVWTSDAAANAAQLAPLEKMAPKPVGNKPAESKPKAKADAG